jgi:RHS repeat-associated protein
VYYSAFGEILTAGGSPGGSAPAGFPRYQYAGAYGYETGGFADDAHLLSLAGTNPHLPPITLQHVGARWYDPALGRFVQRDPIGILGGLNTYAYVFACPGNVVDPSGKGIWKWLYTGDWNAPDNIYAEAVDAAARYVFEHSPIRGGYVGVGAGGTGFGAGGGVGWTIEDGFFCFGFAGIGPKNARLVGWGQTGGGTQLRGIVSGGGAHGGSSTGGTTILGGNYGPGMGGVIIHPPVPGYE